MTKGRSGWTYEFKRLVDCETCGCAMETLWEYGDALHICAVCGDAMDADVDFEFK